MSLEFTQSPPAAEDGFGKVRLDDLEAADRELLEAAQAARQNAYAPYSRFAVGAAARSRSGAVSGGANMENASYGLTLCAEAAALSRAVTDGTFEVITIAVVGGSLADDPKGGDAVTPCGRCRQLIFEAAQVSGEDVRVLCANADLSRIRETKISHLLPHSFGPKDLGLP